MNIDRKRHFHAVDQVPGHTLAEETKTNDGGLTLISATNMLNLGMEFSQHSLEVAVDNPNDYDVIATQGAAGAALIKQWASASSFTLVPLPDAACARFGVLVALTKYYPTSEKSRRNSFFGKRYQNYRGSQKNIVLLLIPTVLPVCTGTQSIGNQGLRNRLPREVFIFFKASK